MNKAEELTAKEFLEIKRAICPKRSHCIKCEFYYGCMQISNANDRNIEEVLAAAAKHKMKQLETA